MCLQEISEGKYRAIISGGYDISGKRKRITKTITAKSKRDAEKQAIQLEAELLNGKVEHSNSYTFHELADKFIALSMDDLSEKTKERYLGIINQFLLPAFGKKRVKDITPILLDEYISELGKDGIRRDGKSGGYSSKTKLHHFLLLNHLFEQAYRWDIISTNPCSKAQKPKLEETEARFYDIEQTKTMLECLQCEPIKYFTYINIALFTGCRRSEVLGLEWGDIDMNDGIISIRRTSQYTPQKGIYTVNKTKNGTACRTVVIPSGLIIILSKFKSSGKCLTGDNDRLFVNDDNLNIPLHPDSISQWFKGFLKRHSLPVISLHQIRHTSVTLMIYQGTDVKTIADQRGHGVDVMLKRYAHVFAQSKTEAANKLQGEFFTDT